MKQFELSREALKGYVNEIAKENELPLTSFCEAQWRVMNEKLEQFVSISGSEGTLLLWFYKWYNYREFDYDKLPWTIPKIPKEQIIEMHSAWSSLENDVIEFTRLNQEILKQQQKQEPELER